MLYRIEGVRGKHSDYQLEEMLVGVQEALFRYWTRHSVTNTERLEEMLLAGGLTRRYHRLLWPSPTTTTLCRAAVKRKTGNVGYLGVGASGRRSCEGGGDVERRGRREGFRCPRSKIRHQSHQSRQSDKSFQSRQFNKSRQSD